MDDNMRSVMSGSGATKRTILGLAAPFASCFVVTMHGQAVATRPELLAGPWEVASPPGVDGIFVKIYQAIDRFDRRTIMRQTIHVRAYRRRGDSETHQWYVVSPPTDATAEFDGRR